MLAGLLFLGGLFYCAAKSASDKECGTGNYYKFPNGVTYYMDKRGCWRLTNGDPISRLGENWVNCKNYKVVFEEGKWKREEETRKEMAKNYPCYLKAYSPEECGDPDGAHFVIDVKTGNRISKFTKDSIGGRIICKKFFYRTKDPKGSCMEVLEKDPRFIVEITEEEFDKAEEYLRTYEVYSRLEGSCFMWDYTNKIMPDRL